MRFYQVFDDLLAFEVFLHFEFGGGLFRGFGFVGVLDEGVVFVDVFVGALIVKKSLFVSLVCLAVDMVVIGVVREEFLSVEGQIIAAEPRRWHFPGFPGELNRLWRVAPGLEVVWDSVRFELMAWDLGLEFEPHRNVSAL